MVQQKRFPRPSVVFLDGDQPAAPGCVELPGGDAPERVVFEGLSLKQWPDVASRLQRGAAETIDALNRAMNLQDHHDWVRTAADQLVVGGDILWQVLASSWVTNCAPQPEIDRCATAVSDLLA